MADDGERSGERADGDRRDDGDEPDRNGGPGFKEYLKLLETILVSLLLFAGLMRGCASCQEKNPVTGEPIQKAPPPPPAPAPPQ